MSLVTLQDAELAYGLHPLLDRANLTVLDGERIGLIGRNGTGKSSLLSAIAGTIALDDGEIKRRDGLAITFVEQEPVLPAASTLRESLAMRGHLERIADERERWRVEARLNEFLHRFGLDEAADPSSASGGERKRAALALAFARQPDLLLLDEPTNHLDIDAIGELEEFVRRAPATIVITHDRAFLDAVATRIVELDRGLLRSYPGNFAAYQSRKSDELAAEEVVSRKFDKFWAQEEVWIRKGVEARRTRNEGRVRRLERLREERAARRDRLGNVRLSLDAGARSGKLVAELENVTRRFGDRTIVRDLSMVIMRGDRIGLIGPNGAGKTTLIRLILGALPPDEGRVRLGTNLEIAYFDQMREQLDPERTLADTISPGSDWIEIGGQRRHVLTYLGEFLFPPERVNAPVKTLSGGERNRLLLARLFARPANLLVLDEPTNDLDIESLELLEETLQGYTGNAAAREPRPRVSRQRRHADAGRGRRRQVAGIRRRVQRLARAARRQGQIRRSSLARRTWRRTVRKGGSAPMPSPASPPARVKLSFKEQRELESLPAELEALEREQHEITARMCAPDYHRQGPDVAKRDRQRAEEVEHLLAEKFERWAALEDKAAAAKAR